MTYYHYICLRVNGVRLEDTLSFEYATVIRMRLLTLQRNHEDIQIEATAYPRHIEDTAIAGFNDQIASKLHV